MWESELAAAKEQQQQQQMSKKTHAQLRPLVYVLEEAVDAAQDEVERRAQRVVVPVGGREHVLEVVPNAGLRDASRIGERELQQRCRDVRHSLKSRANVRVNYHVN